MSDNDPDHAGHHPGGLSAARRRRAVAYAVARAREQAEAFDRWVSATAEIPAMTDEQITTAAEIIRRIEATHTPPRPARSPDDTRPAPTHPRSTDR